MIERDTESGTLPSRAAVLLWLRDARIVTSRSVAYDAECIRTHSRSADKKPVRGCAELRARILCVFRDDPIELAGSAREWWHCD